MKKTISTVIILLIIAFIWSNSYQANTEFMALGAVIYYTFKQIFTTHIAKKSILLAICIASLDEVIQIYTPGRTATIGDVLLDTTGSMIGILIMKGLLKLFH